MLASAPGFRPLRQPLLALLVAVVSACGGGGGDGGGTGGGPGGGPAVDDPMPTSVGDRWVYRTESGGYELVAVEGTRTVQGVQAAVVATTDLGPDVRRYETLVGRSADAMVELPDMADPVAVAIGNLSLLPLPLQVRPSATVLDRSVASGYDYDGDGRPDALTVRLEQGVPAIETVTVPAGTFAGCARVRSVLRLETTLSASGRRLGTTTTIDEWYAPGMGLVRSSTLSEDGSSAATETRELTAWRVGARRSEAQAPVLVRRTPQPDSSSPTVHEVYVEFDELPDPDTVIAGGLVVVGPDDQPLQATVVRMGPKVFGIGRTTPLPTGSYTVRLAGTVSDLLGNTMPAQQWTWSVDARGPRLARSTPAQGAVDVPLNTPLELVFDEPLAAATVDAGTVQLRRGGDKLAATLTLVDSRTVRVTPAAALESGVAYTLWIGELKDALGNRNPEPIELRFSTVQGLLGYPTAVAGADGHLLAIADFDGDGRADLLDAWNVDPKMLRVHPGLPAGGFGAPRLLALPNPMTCPGVDALQAADMTGDGRLDLVVTRCGGVQVLRQEPSGTLSLLADLRVLVNAQIALADLDGDGRLDIVANSIFFDSVTVWRQTAPGVFGAGVQYPAVITTQGGLAVGDVNGDGRPDIVVTCGGAFRSDRALTILPQRADGSFGPPQSRALAGGEGYTAVAVADVDGDGRLDVVVPAPGSGSVWIFRQGADGMLGGPTAIPSPDDQANSIAVADVDGDGRRDLVLALGDSVRVHRQAADGSFDAGRRYAGQQPGRVPLLGVIDATGDGRLDIVVAGPYVLPQLGSATPSATRLTGPRMLRRAIGAPG